MLFPFPLASRSTDRARGAFSALVVTTDRVFGAQQAGALRRAGARPVHVVRTIREPKGTAASETRDLALVDLDLPHGTATGLIAELRNHGWRNIVAVLSPGSSHLTGAAVRSGAGSFLMKPADFVEPAEPWRQNRIGALSAHELRALKLLADGSTDAAIGREIGVSTVRATGLVRRARAKFGARDRAHLVSKAIRANIID
ncbi:hypothetical protein [Lentzea sp. NBRC 102530]|uniref:response regulator transcription factor n=1 Tax=Lentzea sp. NBRC 102530 TaxID=3032201 RepID=UPI0024A2EEC4|nr:hypothetical protein [Lentzea sp. NBRC 102530]GLY46791.1 hypothetical protein Lesp01_04470 [Lentzea sp. NBRC 102530]